MTGRPTRHDVAIRTLMQIILWSRRVRWREIMRRLLRGERLELRSCGRGGYRYVVSGAEF
jgi:hypothetical protein